MTLTEFLLARIVEDEAAALAASPGPWHLNDEHDEVLAVDDDITVCEAFALSGPQLRATAEHVARFDPARVLAECEAKLRIVELHQSWPVLVETQPEVATVESFDVDRIAFSMTKRIAWLTEQEYRNRFGTEPPTAPMLAAMALVYADHPDYDEAWKV